MCNFGDDREAAETCVLQGVYLAWGLEQRLAICSTTLAYSMSTSIQVLEGAAKSIPERLCFLIKILCINYSVIWIYICFPCIGGKKTYIDMCAVSGLGRSRCQYQYRTKYVTQGC